MVQKFAFTDLKIQSLTEGEWWDLKLPAFGIRVGKRDKTFLLKKDNRRIKLGRYGSITLQEARRKALTLKGAGPLNGGTDLTLGEAIELFYRTHCHSYRPRSLYQTQHLLKKIEPLYGKKLGSVTTHDLFAIIDRQKRVAANLTFGAARTFFRFCARRRLIEKSPLQDLGKPHKTQSRSRVLTDKEIAAVWTAAEQCGQFGVIVKLLILTGQRRGEIAALRPEWIKETEELLCLPASATKNGRPNAIPLSASSITILRSLTQSSHSSLIFPARSNKQSSTGFNNWSKSKAALDKASGVKDWTLHDIRRTYATKMADLGVAPHIIERLLNHVSGSISGVAAIYNRAKYLEEMRDAVERFEQHLRGILK